MTDRARSEPAPPVYQRNPGLVRFCIEGDERAWEEPVERKTRLVDSVPRRIGLSEADTDDVSKRVFTPLLRHLLRLRDPNRFSSWLITTTRWECWRLGRSTGHDARLDDAMADGAAAAIEEVAGSEWSHAVRQAIRGLDGRCHSLLATNFLEPQPAVSRVIGRRLGNSVGWQHRPDPCSDARRGDVASQLPRPAWGGSSSASVGQRRT